MVFSSVMLGYLHTFEMLGLASESTNTYNSEETSIYNSEALRIRKPGKF